MLKHFTLFTALILTVFIVGCSEYTEIFINEVNILPTNDGGDAPWLDDIDIPFDDGTPPMMIESTVADGETGIDPYLLNAGGIYVLFNEHVYGTIELQFEDGSPVGWTGVVEGNTAELYPPKGHELDYETTYVVAITVADAAGNISYYSIAFVTATAPPEPAN